MFSVVQDQQSRELSQHHTQRQAKRLRVSEQEVKLPPVVGLDACQVRCPSLLTATLAPLRVANPSAGLLHQVRPGRLCCSLGFC